MTIIIDKARAKALLEEIISEVPQDYRYKTDIDVPGKNGSCHYERGGQPSCIIGHALFRAGVSIEALKEFDAYGEDTSIDHLIGETDLMVSAGLDLTGSALGIFSRVQHKQDNGRPWHLAVTEVLALDWA